MTIADIKKMSIPERLRTMEVIWDSLLYDDIEVSSPDWHRDILSERKKKIDDGTAEFLSIKKVKASHR